MDTTTTRGYKDSERPHGTEDRALLEGTFQRVDTVLGAVLDEGISEEDKLASMRSLNASPAKPVAANTMPKSILVLGGSVFHDCQTDLDMVRVEFG